MRINYLLLAFLGLASTSFSQQMRLLSSDPNNLIIQNTTADYISVKQSVAGILYENFNGLSKVKVMQKGAPELPVFTESLSMPNAGAVAIEVNYGVYQEFENVNILPSKGSLKRDVNPADVPYVFGETYQSDDFFPKKLAEASSPFIFRDTRGITITFYPYQYNPVSKILRVYKDITVTVTTNSALSGINEKTNNRTSNSSFQQLYKSFYLNAVQSTNATPTNPEMIIVAPTYYQSAIQPLINWRVQSGIKTTLVLVDGMVTSTTVKNNISTLYATNPDVTYVLLVGDHQDLPTHSYGTTGAMEELWSDSYYGQLEGTDYYPELLVGRLSGNALEVQRIVSKIINYEKTPVTGNWMTKVGGIGSNEGYGYGDDGEADWEHLRNIGTKLLNFGYTTSFEFYEGSQGGNDAVNDPTSHMISSAINQGMGLLNYTGHGALDIMATGNYTNTSVNGLTNQGSFPFVVSVACNNGTFVGGTSLCEAFLTAHQSNNPTGAIASCGSSILMAWAEPMQTQDEMTELIIGSNPNNGLSTLGELFYAGQVSMLEAYSDSATAHEVMQTWVFFGDPSVTFRSTVPTTIAATHPVQISNQGGNLLVQSAANNAKVTISQGVQVLATGLITDGSASLLLPELSSVNDLTVTLTKKNTIPYQGLITVSSTLGRSNFQKQFTVYPNPATDVISISNSGATLENVDITLFDLNGRVLISEVQKNIENSHTVSLQALSAGMYILSLTAGEKQFMQKIVVK